MEIIIRYNTRFKLFMTTALIFLSISCICQVGASSAAASELQASPNEVQWFRDAKFGMFIHGGPVTLKGTEISWSRGGIRPGMEGLPEGSIPVAEYDSLYKRFNPTKFNAVEWVRIAKEAGCKYLVFTTKHHDGFSMFDSKLTDYKITNSPFKRDVTAELAQACHQAGIKLGLYFTAPDWYNPDFLTERHPRFVRYFASQIRELCSNYGKVSIFWFDMGGPPNLYDGEAIVPMIRRMQPGILINNRLGLSCDYDTPEQRVGSFQNQRPWESCITIADQWSWGPNENVKSLKQCIRTLVSCVVGDGNLLFNVGPRPTGEIEPAQVQRMAEIGKWLKKYGESIYNTRGGPFIMSNAGGSTFKGNRIYLHILDWNDDAIHLPIQSDMVRSCSLLTGGKPLLTATSEGIRISVSKEDRNSIDTIFKLELKSQASRIKPVKVGKAASLATEMP
ncbi:MAG: alpha-L-fucosidase, partial [Armatimonadota bacterium]